MAARHQTDLIFCRKLPGTTPGTLCDKCDGRCPICDSHIRPTTAVRICDECAHTSTLSNGSRKCIVCGHGKATSEAYYCKECTLLERDRDGCPRIVNVGSAQLDLHFDRKRQQQDSALRLGAI